MYFKFGVVWCMAYFFEFSYFGFKITCFSVFGLYKSILILCESILCLLGSIFLALEVELWNFAMDF